MSLTHNRKFFMLEGKQIGKKDLDSDEEDPVILRRGCHNAKFMCAFTTHVPCSNKSRRICQIKFHRYCHCLDFIFTKNYTDTEVSSLSFLCTRLNFFFIVQWLNKEELVL